MWGSPPVELSLANGESYPALTGGFLTQILREPTTRSRTAACARATCWCAWATPTSSASATSASMRGPSKRRGAFPSVPLVFERDGVRRETSLPLAPISVFRSNLFSAFASVASALFLILRARPTPTVRAYFYAAMCTAFARSCVPGGGLQFYAWLAVFLISMGLFFPLSSASCSGSRMTACPRAAGTGSGRGSSSFWVCSRLHVPGTAGDRDAGFFATVS